MTLLDIVGALAEVATTKRAEAVAAAASVNGRLSKPEEKALCSALAVRDPDAPALEEPDTELRDQEIVPLPNEPVAFNSDPSERLGSESYRRAIEQYMTGEVLPYVPDAWVDYTKTRIGYEVPFTRHFYEYVSPRPVEEIDAELRALEEEIQELLDQVSE